MANAKFVRDSSSGGICERPTLLVLVYLSEPHRALVSETYDLVYLPSAKNHQRPAARTPLTGGHQAKVRLVLTNGAYGMTADEIDSLPRLELICTLGVGYENVALDHARTRGIPVANAAGSNADCAADHAMALLLAAVRRIPFLNAGVRQGLWRDDIPRTPQFSGRRLGIVGLGAIGRKIAARARGFGLTIGYFSRSRRDETGFQFFESVLQLAAWCDFLILAAPGGHDTHHLVDASVLSALGPTGVLINVARGTLVDTRAVADALRTEQIMAVGLDVYEGEPAPPHSLLEFDNAILTPHTAGISPEAISASVHLFLDNASRHLSGLPLLTPVS